MSVQNKRYVILGGSGGIGSALTRWLTDRDARVMIAARSPDKLAEMTDQTGASSYECDATDTAQVEALFDHAVEQFGGLDGAVNCVCSILLNSAHRTEQREWEQTLALNLDTAFYTVRASTPHLQHDGGSIVLISTAAAQIGLANHDAIAAAKAGVIGLTRSAAASYAKWGIRVNCVAPGLVETPLADPILQSEASRTLSEKMHPLGRLGRPEDVASAIEWFLDDEQGWVTGQVLGVDGGLGQLKIPVA